MLLTCLFLFTIDDPVPLRRISNWVVRKGGRLLQLAPRSARRGRGACSSAFLCYTIIKFCQTTTEKGYLTEPSFDIMDKDRHPPMEHIVIYLRNSLRRKPSVNPYFHLCFLVCRNILPVPRVVLFNKRMCFFFRD